MSALQLQDLPFPDIEYQINFLSNAFETMGEATDEDATRAKKLRKQALLSNSELAAELLALADIIDPAVSLQTPETLASSRFMRQLRITTTGALLKVAIENGGAKLRRYDLVKPGGRLLPRDFQEETATGFRAKLRADILRSASDFGLSSVSDIHGFFVGFLHGELTQSEDQPDYLHPHYHLLVSDDYIPIIENIRFQPGYCPTESTMLPIRARRDLYDLPHGFSYLLKSYWPAKWHGTVSNVDAKRRTRHHRRIPEPHHSTVLLWLHKTAPSDLILKMGIHQSREGFHVKNQ